MKKCIRLLVMMSVSNFILCSDKPLPLDYDKQQQIMHQYAASTGTAADFVVVQVGKRAKNRFSMEQWTKATDAAKTFIYQVQEKKASAQEKEAQEWANKAQEVINIMRQAPNRDVSFLQHRLDNAKQGKKVVTIRGEPKKQITVATMQEPSGTKETVPTGTQEVTVNSTEKQDKALIQAAEVQDVAHAQEALQHNPSAQAKSAALRELVGIKTANALEIINALLTQDPPSFVNMPDQYGNTALMFAAMANNEPAVTLLLANTADSRIEDVHHKTAYDMTTKEEIRTLIIDARRAEKSAR